MHAAAPAGAGSTCRRAHHAAGRAKRRCRSDTNASSGLARGSAAAITKPRRQFARHVLHRMHRDIGAVLEHRDFELLDEQALAADLGERAILDAVALCRSSARVSTADRHAHGAAGRRRARPATARACCGGWRCGVADPLKARSPQCDGAARVRCRSVAQLRSRNGTARPAARARSGPGSRPDEPERRETAHDADEDGKGRHFGASGNQEWPQEVVDRADDEDAPDRDERRSARSGPAPRARTPPVPR